MMIVVGFMLFPGHVMAFPEGALGVELRSRDPRPARRSAAPGGEALEQRRVLKDLKNPDPRLRGDAAWAAGRQRLLLASPGLRPLLKDRDSTVRRSAAWAIGELGLPENALAVYDRIIREKEPTVVAELAVALGKMRYMTARPLLLGMTWSGDPVLVQAGIMAVGHLGDVQTAGYLLRFVRSSDPAMRQATAVALGMAGGQGARRALRQLLTDPSAAVQVAALEAVALLGDREAVPQVLSLLGASFPGARLAAVRALRGLGTSKEIPALSPRLDDEEAEVAAEAALSLSVLGGEVPEARVLALLSSSHNGVRRAAAESAGLSGIRGAIGALEALLEHPSIELRITVVEALGRLAATQSLPRLRARLAVEPAPVRVALLRAIGALRAISALVAVTAWMKDPHPEVRAAALGSLAQMATLDPRPFSDLAPLLPGFLRPRQPASTLRAAADLVGRLAPPWPRAGFVALVRLTLHGDPGVREAAARSLGRLGDSLSRPALERLQRDPDPGVQLEAHLALSRLKRGGGRRAGGGTPFPDCERFSGVMRARCLCYRASVDPSARAKAVEAFREELRQGPNTPDRALLVDWLADSGAPFAVPLLTEAAEARSYLFRARALRALSVWPPPRHLDAPLSSPQHGEAGNAPQGGAHGSETPQKLALFDPDSVSSGCGCSLTGSCRLPLVFLPVVFLALRRPRGRRQARRSTHRS